MKNNLFTCIKNIYIEFRGDNDLTESEKEYIKSIPSQNPFGILTMLFGGTGFLFGNNHIWVALLSILFGILSYKTFDKVKHDNPWTFYIGITLGALGAIFYIIQYKHILL